MNTVIIPKDNVEPCFQPPVSECHGGDATCPGKCVKNIRFVRGYSLLEIMLGIAIVGGIMYAVLNMSGIVGTDSKVQSFNSDLMGFATKVQSHYNNANTYENIEEQNLINAGLVPQSLFDPKYKNGTGTAAIFKSPWGTMTIASAESETGIDNGTFALTINTLPQEVCNRIAMLVNNTTFWEKLTINGTDTWNINDESSQSNLVDEVAQACNESSSNNVIEFKARRQ